MPQPEEILTIVAKSNRVRWSVPRQTTAVTKATPSSFIEFPRAKEVWHCALI